MSTTSVTTHPEEKVTIETDREVLLGILVAVRSLEELLTDRERMRAMMVGACNCAGCAANARRVTKLRELIQLGESALTGETMDQLNALLGSFVGKC